MKIPDQLVPVVENVVSKIRDLDEKQRYYIFAGILVFIFAVDYFILMRPQIGALQKINSEIKKVSDNIKTAENDSKNIPNYRENMRSIQGKIDDLEKRVLSRNEESAILERISDLAGEYQIKITRIIPDIEADEVVLTNNDRKYFKFPISIEARSGYHDFGKFLNSLEKDVVYLRVQEFSLTSGGESQDVNIKLTLNAIVYENKQVAK